MNQGEKQIVYERATVRSPLYYGWVVLAVCFVVIAFISSVIPSFSLFYVAVLEDLNWNRGSTALAMSIHLVLSGAASPFAGGLIDRFDPRRVMPIGALVAGGALLCMSRSTALWHFYIAFGVMAAIGGAILHIVPLTTIVSNWFVLNRGTAIGIVSAGSGAGQLVLLPLIGYLIHRIGFGAGFFIISVHLVAYLLDKGYSSILAATVVGLQGFITIIGTIVGGALSDRIGREKTLTLSIAVLIVCILLLNIGGLVVSPMIIYVFAVLYGIGYGMAQPALIASVADLFEGKHFGSILGVIILGAFAGGAVGTWLGGYLFDLTRGYQLNFLGAAVVMFISAGLIWMARPARVRIVRTAPAN